MSALHPQPVPHTVALHGLEALVVEQALHKALTRGVTLPDRLNVCDRCIKDGLHPARSEAS